MLANNKYITEKLAISGAYNSALRKMITKNKNIAKDETVNKLSKLANLALDADPLIGLKHMGPYIDRFCDEVEAGRIDFFLNLDYASLVRTDKNFQDRSTDAPADATDTYIKDIIRVAEVTKNNWMRFGPVERDLMIKDFREMIKQYSEYYRMILRESTGQNAVIVFDDVAYYDPGTSRNAIFNIIGEKIAGIDYSKAVTILVKISSHDYCLESRLDNIMGSDVEKAARIIKKELFERIDKNKKHKVNIYGVSG